MGAPMRSIAAVVIGASTGGVEALLRILPALRGDASFSVLVVLHLPRERSSLLVEIFAPRCNLPVREVLDKDPILAGSIYFAPPDYHLLVDDGPCLALSMDPPVEHSRPSVSVLFESAAAVYGPHLLAVLLTGAGSDGASGLQAVQRAGGMTVVQHPANARMPQMPEAGLARVTADHVLTLEDIMSLFQALPCAGRA
ncbi:MAG: chemotaxis protein CheB [Lysobacterales bacterium 69-70]|nr:chemotaxis protein CheB [Xanthomonadaceae bacterium]ODU33650.1 MAG: chemotaxis protein CheB [Xanthomonadaceae bacterium SCN 69-320]ODV21905.1 MAG: chemotaxis protein CheB [Xanthomonadaceae bacterium SCN 69-25]OJZ02808.1 MAG: chemotaxis protein CheB [Xanthomonadales bacterium 69-70]